MRSTSTSKDCASCQSVLERRDAAIVASVSAICGVGNPEDYHQMRMTLRVGDKMGSATPSRWCA